ncbi:MAG: MBL fold metallo-hydrolase [Myxococcales bacterium]|nr:MBL fold metallo-hydrolase [Myxococcales bacterium]
MALTSRALTLSLTLTLMGCAARQPAGGAPTPCEAGALARPSDTVEARCLTRGTWVFTALAPDDFALPRYPANGLVYESPRGAVMVDAGWRPSDALAIARWSAARGWPVTRAVVTHFHSDRVGGAAALRALDIAVFASPDTLARLGALPPSARPNVTLTPDALAPLTWFAPGPGHSPDNLVVMTPDGALFGGCFIKERDATSLGNLADADLTRWPESLARLRARYPHPRWVIPGHGPVGDAALIAHTLDLVNAAP